MRPILALTIAFTAFGQTAPRAFNVASIKVHEGPMHSLGVTTRGKGLTADASNLGMLLMYAYNVKNFQVTGTAPLIKQSEDRWDIQAKAEGDGIPSKEEFREMMRTLLAERFHLKAHRETRDYRVYALIVGKNGAKLKESAPDSEPHGNFSLKGRNNVITLTHADMSEIVDAVAGGFVDRPVVDATGLKGAYDVQLTYTPNRWKDEQLGDLSVFQAVEEQLGLKLEPRTAPVEFLVVDSAEKPSSN